MKLLFSNGSIEEISDYAKQTVVVSGESLEAVLFTFTGTTLDAVKAAFDDTDKLEKITIYDDESEVAGELVGYTKRVSTSIIDEAGGTYSVTLAKGTDIPGLLKSMETAISGMSERLSKYETALNTYASAKEETDNLITNLTSSLDQFNEAVKLCTERCTGAEKKFLDKETSISNIDDTLKNIASAYQTIQSTVESIYAAYENMSQDVAEVKRSSAAAAKHADETKILADNTASSAKTAVGKLDSVTKNMSDMNINIESLQESSNKISETVASVTEASKTQNENLKKIEEQTGELDKKLTSLIPETDITKMTLSEAKAYKIVESQLELSDYLEEHPITSTCHGGVEATYSITKDKQSYLQAMILTTQMAEKSGVSYQPSWNATGQPCTYDWTLAELQQLAFEIESVVRPLISKQQKIESLINSCTSIEELAAVEISYSAS